MTTKADSKVLPATLTIAAVALIVGLFGHALIDFAEAREKTGSRSRIVIAMISVLPDRDGDVRFITGPAQAAAPESVAAAARPQPSVAPLAAPTPSGASIALADVERIQRKWAVLWSERDANGFLKLYDPAFPDFERHVETRMRRIQAAREISVDIQELRLASAGPDTVVARFTQHYRSDAHQDSVTKEIVWKRTAAGYRIISEKTVKP